ncbi:MAG: hypothetical protein MK207_02090 [Saprospiraceae bacterium]|nr:hypothetical protein [Saprospiraceae bacterium]
MSKFEKENIMAPIKQFALFFVISIAGIFGASFIASDLITIWSIAASMLLLFSVINNGLSIYTINYKSYLIHSVYSFVALLISLVLLSTLLSGMTIFEATPYRNIFLVILITNFIFISMIMLIKGLLIFLSEKDSKL